MSFIKRCSILLRGASLLGRTLQITSLAKMTMALWTKAPFSLATAARTASRMRDVMSLPFGDTPSTFFRMSRACRDTARAACARSGGGGGDAKKDPGAAGRAPRRARRGENVRGSRGSAVSNGAGIQRQRGQIEVHIP